jgi:hypothetical protein
MKSALCAEAARLLRPDNAKPLFPFPPPSSSAFRRFIQLQCFNVNGSSSARSARATAQTVTCPWGNGRAQPFQSKHFCCNVADSQKESEAGDVLFHMVTCRSAGRLGRWQDRRGGRIRNIGRHSPRNHGRFRGSLVWENIGISLKDVYPLLFSIWGAAALPCATGGAEAIMLPCL